MYMYSPTSCDYIVITIFLIFVKFHFF